MPEAPPEVSGSAVPAQHGGIPQNAKWFHLPADTGGILYLQLGLRCVEHPSGVANHAGICEL